MGSNNSSRFVPSATVRRRHSTLEPRISTSTIRAGIVYPGPGCDAKVAAPHSPSPPFTLAVTRLRELHCVLAMEPPRAVGRRKSSALGSSDRVPNRPRMHALGNSDTDRSRGGDPRPLLAGYEAVLGCSDVSAPTARHRWHCRVNSLRQVCSDGCPSCLLLTACRRVLQPVKAPILGSR